MLLGTLTRLTRRGADGYGVSLSGPEGYVEADEAGTGASGTRELRRVGVGLG